MLLHLLFYTRGSQAARCHVTTGTGSNAERGANAMADEV